MGRWTPDGRYVDHVNEIEDFKSSGMVPTEEQAKYTPQEKILSAVTVNAGITTAFTSNLITMDGFNSVSTCAVTTAHNFTFELLSSPDGTQVISDNGVSRTGSTSTKKADSSNLMAFALVRITNNDAANKTYDVWARKYNI